MYKNNECGYLNSDNTCNSTLLCDNAMCIAIKDNYNTVKQKAKTQIKSGKKLLHAIKEARLNKCKKMRYDLIDIPIDKALVAVEKEFGCTDCILYPDHTCRDNCYFMACEPHDRKDGKNVIFKLIDLPKEMMP